MQLILPQSVSSPDYMRSNSGVGPTMQTAAIVKEFTRRVAIPCHYDMMINNVVSPEMLRVALDVVGSGADFTIHKVLRAMALQAACRSNRTPTAVQVT